MTCIFPGCTETCCWRPSLCVTLCHVHVHLYDWKTKTFRAKPRTENCPQCGWLLDDVGDDLGQCRRCTHVYNMETGEFMGGFLADGPVQQIGYSTDSGERL